MKEERTTHPSGRSLQGVALLAGLGGAELDALARECAWRRYPPGQQILSRDARDRDLYLLVAGRVRITTYSLAGREVTFRDIGAGECFGDIAAIDGLPRSADVVAIDSTLVAAMKPALMWRLLQRQPVVARRMLESLAGLVRQLTERVTDLSTLGVRNRIQAELLRRARAAGVRANTARIHPPPRHTELASRVGTYREQVTRELSALAKAGILRKENDALIVCDVGRLETLVEGARGIV